VGAGSRIVLGRYSPCEAAVTAGNRRRRGQCRERLCSASAGASIEPGTAGRLLGDCRTGRKRAVRPAGGRTYKSSLPPIGAGTLWLNHTVRGT
jgi:hypothetical protein